MPITAAELAGILWHGMDVIRSKGGDVYSSPSGLIGVLFYKVLSDRSAAISFPEEHGPSATWAIPVSYRWSSFISDPSDDAAAQLIQSMQADFNTHDLGDLLITLGTDRLLRIRELRHRFEGINLADVEPDVISAAIEAFMEKAAQLAGGKATAGAYLTPSNIALLLAELLLPKVGASIYDPACGVGNLLLAVNQFQKRLDEDASTTQFFAQERNTDAALLAQMNMILCNIPNADIRIGSSLTDPQFLDGDRLRHFDYVISSPPLGMSLTWDDVNRLQYLHFGDFSYRKPTRSADIVYIQHALAVLSTTGRAVLLVTPSLLMRTGAEGEIRKHIVENDYVEAVISLPSGLLYGTTISTAVLVLNKNKPDHLRGRIIIVYADKDADTIRRRQLDEQQRQGIVRAVHDNKPKRGFSMIATLEQVRYNNYILTPARYFVEQPRISFLGQEAEWKRLSDLASILMGVPGSDRDLTETGDSIIRGRDLSKLNLQPDDLAKMNLSQHHGRLISAQVGDVLIQRIGQKPHAVAVSEAIAGVAVHQTVLVIRLQSPYRDLAPYLAEFLNSDTGRSWLSAHTRGAVIPGLYAAGLRELLVPMPDPTVRNMLDTFRKVEQDLVDYLEKTRDLRQSLFSLEDVEQASTELLRLSTRAKALSSAFAQADDSDFQIRNFYPFPLAFTYRMLGSQNDDPSLYREQLRLVENILAFTAVIEMALVVHTKDAARQQNTKLTQPILKNYWQSGISPGHWLSIIRDSSSLLRSSGESSISTSLASLWFKGSTDQRSKFATLLDDLVQRKNDFKHDRGPHTPDQYSQSVRELNEQLRECLGHIAVFTQYPIHLVERARKGWRTHRALLDTRIYVGDHQAMPRNQIETDDVLPDQHLYIRISENEWVSLYPLITVQYCPTCQMRETYFVERYDGRRAYLKSFERGHVIENTTEARIVGEHLQLYFQDNFPA